MIDIIKEYLISIGTHVDKKSFADAEKVFKRLDGVFTKLQESVADTKPFKAFGALMDKAEGWITAFAASTLGRIAAVSAGLVALGGLAAAVILKFMTNMGRADMQVQMFARRMLTTVENARSLKAVMAAMNVNSLEELQDVALNPELRAQFLQLRKDASALSLTREQQEGFKNIRTLTFAFQRLQVVMDYFWQTLGAELGQALDGPLKDMSKAIASFAGFVRSDMPGLVHGLASIVGIVFKLVSLLIKVAAIGYRLPFIGGVLREIGSNLNGILDVINALLDALGRGLDKGSERNAAAMADPYNATKNAVKSLEYYVRRIYDVISGAWRFLTGWIRPIRDWATGKMADLQKNPITKGIIGAITGAPAEAATPDVIAPLGGGPAVGGKFAVNRGVAFSRNISRFVESIKNRLPENFTITAGLAKHGHLSHGGGNALDIGLAGKSDRSITGLVREVLRTPGVRVANLELSMGHYRRILRQLEAQGVPTDRVVNQKSKYSHGDHLHVGLRPIEVSINVNGAQDPKAVATAVRRELESINMQTLRHQQGAFA